MSLPTEFDDLHEDDEFGQVEAADPPPYVALPPDPYVADPSYDESLATVDPDLMGH